MSEQQKPWCTMQLFRLYISLNTATVNTLFISFSLRPRRDILDWVWNVMAHAQKPDFVLRRNGRVHLNRWWRQFSLLLASELCTSVCRVCTARARLCSAVMWRLLVTHFILLFPLHFSSRASLCAIIFQLDSISAEPYTELYVGLLSRFSPQTQSNFNTSRAVDANLRF
jgi:hypothetical protein